MSTIPQAVELWKAGRLTEAEAVCRAVLAAAPDRVDGLLLLADIEFAGGRPDAAIARWRCVLAAQPTDAATHRRLAGALLAVGQPSEAASLLRRALVLEPDNIRALNNLGHALLNAGDAEAARAPLLRAISLEPAYAIAHNNLGSVYQRLGAFSDALASFDQARRLAPALGSAQAGRGFALERLGRAEEALDAYGRAVELGWVDAQALLRVGALMVRLNRFDNALAAFREAQRLLPDSWRAKEGTAMVLAALRRYEEAVPVLEELRRMAPWIKNLPGHHFHARLHCCDWRDYHATAAEIASRVRGGEHADSPWTFLIHNADPALQLQSARLYAADQCVDIRPIRRGPRTSRRIRLAYLSADFHAHATSFLAAGLFECHDRSRFETTAISYGPPDDGPMRRRLQRAFERFVDVSSRSDEAIALLMDELEIDIAVDMKGYTTGGRMQILAHRPAPVQIAFLAYPGTTGCSFIDYVVADRHVIGDSDRTYYSEQVIWMPGSYQANDAVLCEAPGTTRHDVGLPDTGFVFCCFNASFKISPDIFDIWMRILGQVEGSVLWLLEGPAAAVRNLRSEAARRGVNGLRLVFAPLLPVAEHQARIHLADLFLDTLPCNAHTTASDALRAGVPLITVAGSSFAGRVATSLLRGIGVPELSVASLADYERLAIRLARAPVELGALRARVEAARRTGSLFDAAGYCRHLEAAFAEIHARQRRGELPSPLDVAALVGEGATG
ncbi:MAG: tetratricopeptide repeat protein [Steroidobacteraceae bacterium]